MTSGTRMAIGVIQQRIERIFHDHLDLRVDPDLDILESGIMDSLVLVRLIVRLEEEFGIVVDVESLDLEDLRSISCVARYVEARTSDV